MHERINFLKSCDAKATFHPTLNFRHMSDEMTFDTVAIPCFAIGFAFFFSGVAVSCVSCDSESIFFLSVVHIVCAFGTLSMLCITTGVFSNSFAMPLSWADVFLLTISASSVIVAALFLVLMDRSNDLRTGFLLVSTSSSFIFILACAPRFFIDIELNFMIPVLASMFFFNTSAAAFYTFLATEHESLMSFVRRSRRTH